MRELICIVCPRGCHLTVDEDKDYAVTGNHCPRGEVYAKKECTHPTRVLTSSVKIEGSSQNMVSVKTSCDIDKDKIFDVMQVIETLVVQAPVHRGQVLVSHICDTDANLIVTKDLAALKK